MDGGKCDVIFKVISGLNNAFDQIETNDLSQKKNIDDFLKVLYLPSIKNKRVNLTTNL